MRELSYNRAIMEAMREEMLRDDTVFVMGEDVEAGVMRKTFGLIDEFGPERVRDTALAEVGFIGAAVGAAAAGTRPIAELMFWVHSYMAMDQIINQAAKPPIGFFEHIYGISLLSCEGAQRFVIQKFCIANQMSKRGAQFMGHISNKIRL